MLDRLIENLSNLDPLSPTYVDDFERILSNLAAQNDPTCISRLVMFFDDNAKYDELMFSIIHTLEVFEDTVYAREIQQSLPVLWPKSPRWALIIHMRILNSPTALDAYIARLSRASVTERNAIRELLQALEYKRPEFSTRCSLINDRIASL